MTKKKKLKTPPAPVRVHPPVSPLTADDFFGTLTGFDEIAVARSFGAEVTDLRKRPFTFLRSLVFVDARRRGESDGQARESALGLTLAHLSDYFADDEPELDPDEPVTAMGKGAALPE